MSCKPIVKSKAFSCLIIGCGGSLTFAGINIYKGNDRFYANVVMPAIHRLTDAETAHVMAIKLAKHGFVPKYNEDSNLSPILRTTLWGLNFSNPIGLAAGFDKDGQAIKGLSKLGFGFIEVGSVTPEPQPGNEKPRVFRLISDKAIINRYGFNSAGHDSVKLNIEKQTQNIGEVKVGINLGKNKLSQDIAEDYIKGLIKFSDTNCIDYFVINISSPNTPHLRDLQKKTELNDLIEKVLKVKIEYKIDKPLLIKIAPDLSPSEIKDISSIINKYASKKSKRGIDGLIISNTTIDRPLQLESEPSIIIESGGLSGIPLRETSTDMIRKMYKLTNGNIPIIGVGGVFSGEDAYHKIKAGASLVQIYTAMTYEGPQIVNRINRELAQLLKSDGFENVNEAIGTDHK